MSANISQKLKSNIHLACCSCKDNKASHAYRFEYDGACFQLCVCNECIAMGDQKLSDSFLNSL